ncbi:MAG: nucleoside hydrolase [Actinomycetota bacterium]|jgi:inosine-uridine nucleoside N-ribohydrolase|nr:nucleoside hydrolase [Actinomycetota bacterium]
MARTRVLIDTDPGVDDAVALLLALASPELDVVGVVAVNGNVSLDKTALNARRIVALAGRDDVPVCAGCARPLSEPVIEDSLVHGHDGLGDLEWNDPAVALDARDGVDFIAEMIDQGPLTIVAIGPLTNLAVLLQRYPGIEGRVEHVVIMGGASLQGNVTPAAEFNIWADPEAARVVFDANWRITLMPLDLTHQAFLDDDDLAYFSDLGTEVGRRTAAMLEPYAQFHERWYGTRDVIMHDAMAVYELLDPHAITKQGVRLAVEVGGVHSRGATFIDRRREHAQSEVRVGVRVDNDRFRSLLRQRLATYAD